MQRTVTASLGWRVQAWEQPCGRGASEDAQLVWPDPGGGWLRVAVLDGVTPTRACRGVVGVAGAMYAAAVTRLALQRPGSGLRECVLAANEHLHDRGLARSRDQAQACVTAADVYPDGRVVLVRAGDCEAWARTARGWVALGSGSALSAPARVAWDEWQERHPGASRALRHAGEEGVLGRPEAWTSSAVGRFARPVLRGFSLAGVSELVLASDGARLSERVLEDLPGWIGGLRGFERERAHLARAGEKLHDDVTVLRLVRGRAALTLAAAA
jgi:hypothetical protein